MKNKNVLIAAACAATALLAAGCVRQAETVSTDTNYRVVFGGNISNYAYVGIFADPVTGCESYVTDDGFMSPRLNADGTQRCRVSAPAPTLR